MNDAMTRHSEAETLAAFVDGRLEGDELAEVAAHVESCEECRMMIGEAVRFGREEASAAAGKAFRWWIPAAAAVLIAIIAVPLIRNQVKDPFADLQPKGTRPYEPRLSFINYADYRPVRGGESEEEPNWQAEGVSSELRGKAKKNPSAKNLHRAGVSVISFKHSQEEFKEGNPFLEAVKLLEQAHQKAPDDANILSDLAAAQIIAHRPAEAAKNAARALELDPELAPAAFNRALALQDQNNPQAAAAWRRYLLLDPNSAWTTEALQHLKLLTNQ